MRLKMYGIFLLVMISIITIGTIGFYYLENLSFFDALWLTFVTVLTVGYGDIYPKTVGGKIFAFIVISLGIGFFAYVIGFITANIIEGEFSQNVRRRRMEGKIKNLQNHIILCGLGRIGYQVAVKLLHENIPFVAIEQDLNTINKFSQKILTINGDATEETVLRQAGIEKAAGLVAALPVDADNLVIVLTAREINPVIHIVARAEKTESEGKLQRIGANVVINPAKIGGKRIALSVIRPNSIEYMDKIFHNPKEDFGIDELKITANAKVVGQKIREIGLREQFGITILTIKRVNQYISNPHGEEKIELHDVIIVVGENDKLIQFKKEML